MSDIFVPTLAERERLVQLIEECAEVIQAATKVERFGYGNFHPRTREGNRAMLTREIADVRAAMLLMMEARDIDGSEVENLACEKLAKLRDIMKYQRKESE